MTPAVASAALPELLTPALGSAASFETNDSPQWGIALGIAAVLHAAALVALAALGVSTPPPTPEPVVLIELPPEAAPAPAAIAARDNPQPQIDPRAPIPEQLTPPIDVPPVKAPLPRDAVNLPPPPPPLPARAAPAAPAPVSAAPTNTLATTRTGTGTGTSATPGDNAKAKAQEADYFALVSAHLNRRKQYPTEAKKARQQGVVTVRFTVDRAGNVSGVSIKRSSGHDVLDQATLALLQRVAPLPRMPASMQRDSVTLALPIDYSLKTS